jgi:hypothetical protein
MPCQLFSEVLFSGVPGEFFSSATAILVSREAYLLALIPGAAKLDVIGEIVNMFQPYPALRLAPLQPGCDDVR